MTFQIQYATRGLSFWPRRYSNGYGHTDDSVTADLRFFQNMKAQGMNVVGLTLADEAYQRGTGRDDFYSFFRVLEIPLALGMRVLLRTQSMIHMHQAFAKDPQRAWDEFYSVVTPWVKKYDPRKLCWSIMAEPALLSRIVTNPETGNGEVHPLPASEFQANVANETARLEDMENFLFHKIRAELPYHSLGRSAPDWANLTEPYGYDLLSRSVDTNCFQTCDFYWGSGSPEPYIRRFYNKCVSMGRKPLMAEFGWTGATAEKATRENQVWSVCQTLRIPALRWTMP